MRRAPTDTTSRLGADDTEAALTTPSLSEGEEGMTTDNSSTGIEAYTTFLEHKRVVAVQSGITVDPGEIHPLLKPHQRLTVAWAVQGGRRAIFHSFGMGKSLQQLEICRLIMQHKGGAGLIVCPLNVRREFLNDARKIALPIRFIQETSAIDGDGLYLTNYESVREGKLDPSSFTVISLDEAAVLRSGGASKTFRTLMGYFEGTSTFRFLATAVPAPNDYTEMLVYSDWLGVMDQSEAKTRFFKRDSTKADRLTLHAHKEEEWYRWLASWAVFLQSPAQVCTCGCHEGVAHA